MINRLRKTIHSFLLKVVFGVIILSFILSGVGNYLIRSKNNYAIKVNGQKISRIQFEKFFTNENLRIREQFGDRYSEFKLNEQYMKNLRYQVLNHIIDEVLIEQFAKKLGLLISDEQVKAAIFSTQEFQSHGKFDNSLYKSIINKMGISTFQYAQELRNRLMIQQLINAIIYTDFILKDEAEELISLLFQQRVIREAIINVKDLATQQQISDMEAKNYYEKNKKNFVAKEQFRVSYIKLDAEEIKENVSDAEIQSYYKKYQKEFIKPQCSHYSIIHTKTENNAKILLDELHKGMKFSTIAKSKSTDTISAKHGGDLGCLQDDLIPDEIKNAGLKKKGELSGVIKCSHGYLIVRLDGIKLAKVKLLTKVYDEIATKIKKKKQINSFYNIKKKIIDSLNYNENKASLVQVEQITGIKAVDTNFFSQDNLPEELNFKQVINTIFNNSIINKSRILKRIPYIIDIDHTHAFVLHITDHNPERIKSFIEIKDQILHELKNKKAIQQAKLQADKLLSNLLMNRGKENDVLKKVGLTFSLPKTLTRREEQDSSIKRAVFTLTKPLKDKPSYGISNDEQGNIVLLALDEVKTEKILEPQKKLILHDFAQYNAQITIEALAKNLRKKAKIIISDDYFK